jgi:hypothetical protein
VPERFGGGFVDILQFGGFITLESTPSGNPGVDFIRVIGGMASAPSVPLPDGTETGINNFEFIGHGATTRKKNGMKSVLRRDVTSCRRSIRPSAASH